MHSHLRKKSHFLSGGRLFVVFNERYYEEQYQGYANRLDKGISEFEESGLWMQTNKNSIPCLDVYNAIVIVLQKT